MPSPVNQRNADPIGSALRLLRKLASPQAVIHVGAGRGTGEMHLWRQWDVPNAWIIEANAERLPWTKAIITQSGLHVVNAVLAETSGDAQFYQTTSPDEDGLISPKQLHSIWPNLQTKASTLRTTRRLDDLLDETGTLSSENGAPCWVFIDCHPALLILKGSGRYLDYIDVLVARVMLKPVWGEDTTLDALQTYLQPQGFRLIESVESNHPALGLAIFVRDWKTTLQPRVAVLSQAYEVLEQEKMALATRQSHLEYEVSAVAQVRDQQDQLATHQRSQVQHITQLKNEQAELAAKRQQQLEALQQECADLERRLLEIVVQSDELQKSETAMKQVCDEKTQLSAERLTLIEQLIQERDVQVWLVAELQQKIEALQHEKVGLEQERQGIVAQRDELQNSETALKQLCDKQTELAAERLALIERLTHAGDTQARMIAEHQQQIEMLQQAHAGFEQELLEVVAQRDELLKTEAAMKQARDQQIQLSTERLALIEQLTQARDAQTRLVIERDQQIEALHNDKAGLEQKRLAIVARRDELQNSETVLKQVCDKQTGLAAERLALIEQLIQARDAQARLATERQQQIEVLHQANALLVREKSLLEKRRDELQVEVSAAKQARDDQKRFSDEKDDKFEQIIKAKDEQTRLSAERKQQIEVLIQQRAAIEMEKSAAIAELGKLKDELKTAVQVRNDQVGLTAQCKLELEQIRSQSRKDSARVSQLENELIERDARQQMLNDEMTRAEAQIDLIKDVLLREQGL